MYFSISLLCVCSVRNFFVCEICLPSRKCMHVFMYAWARCSYRMNPVCYIISYEIIHPKNHLLRSQTPPKRLVILRLNKWESLRRNSSSKLAQIARWNTLKIPIHFASRSTHLAWTDPAQNAPFRVTNAAETACDIFLGMAPNIHTDCHVAITLLDTHS